MVLFRASILLLSLIAGTNICIARRKGRVQRAPYSGHKRRHAIKRQTVTTPGGHIFQIGGLMEGRRHDMKLLRGSGIDCDLQGTIIIEGV